MHLFLNSFMHLSINWFVFVQDINDCTAHVCLHGGTCQDEVNDYTCLCTEGYTGERCETGNGECYVYIFTKRTI